MTCLFRYFDKDLSCENCAMQYDCPKDCQKICQENRCGEDPACAGCDLILMFGVDDNGET